MWYCVKGFWLQGLQGFARFTRFFSVHIVTEIKSLDIFGLSFSFGIFLFLKLDPKQAIEPLEYSFIESKSDRIT